MSLRQVWLPFRAVSSKPCAPRFRSSFSTAAICRVQEDPATAMLDAISPAKTRRPPQTPVPSSTPDQPPPAENPALADFPNSENTPPSPADAPLDFSGDASSDSQFNTIYSLLQEGLQKPQRQPRAEPPKAVRQQQTVLSRGADRMMERQFESQMERTWRAGDVYAPHDLSPAEQMKARYSRSLSRSAVLQRPRNTRKHGWRDVVDDLGINPLLEYKNFSMMSEYMSEMGRIKHSRITGLRSVNQRKMAKAIRRAIGIGILPSVHRHPELFAERLERRGQRPMRVL